MDALSKGCPSCGAEAGDPDCETCGYDFTAARLAVTYSRGASKYDNTPNQCEASDFVAFRAAILADNGSTAKGQTYICGACAIAPDDANHTTTASFRKAIGKAHRCAKCVQSRTWIGLDVDGGLTPESWAALIAHLQRYLGCAYTTSSHTAAAPRARVVIALDAPAGRADMIHASAAMRARLTVAMVADGYAAPKWDASCDKPEQPLYLPLMTAETYTMDGTAAVLADLLAEARAAEPASAPATAGGTVGGIVVNAQTVTHLRGALAHLRADERGTWIDVGQNLKCLGDVGRGLWLEWSQTSAEWLPGDAKKWNDLAGDRSDYRAVFSKAQKAGWVNPMSNAAQVGAVAAFRLATAHDPCTHLANAQRIVKHFGTRLLYVEGIGWHTWAPPWRADELGARRIVQGLGQIIANEAAAMAPWVAQAGDKNERAEREAAMNRRFKWAGYSESAPTIEHSLKMAAPLLACKADAMDADPDLLGLPSGVLELASGTHRDHRHTDRITKVAGCHFDPAATAPTWERFVAQAMAGDVELIDYLQRLCGYALSGRRGEHLLPILWGSGANGKSTFLGALQAMLGEYAGAAAPGLLIQRGGADHPTGLADLQGRRLVVVSETGETGRLNEEQAKLLTGGDAITARRMRMDFYTFTPTHLLLLQTNHRPRVTGTDEGVWRRLRLVPFTVTVPAKARDRQLPDKLRAELPGILAWAWRGWQRYQADGFNDPAAVRLATSEYREASDAVGAFLGECCNVHPHLTATAGALYKGYVQWCEEAGERPRSQREFGMRLAERGFEQARTSSARRWRGLALASSVASDECDPGFGLNARESLSRRGYTESPVTSVTRDTCPRCGGEGCDWCRAGRTA